jgi:hypothetical protein
MKRKPLTDAQLDVLANDGRLSRIAMRLAADAGESWPRLDSDAQDAWHERAIKLLRSGEIAVRGF